MPRARTNSRFKEAQIAGFLDEWHVASLIPDFRWNRQNPKADTVQCGRYRPDFAFEGATGVVILEVDEDQHARNELRCELLRMAEVSMGYGGMPVHWIRYNPDAFKLGDASMGHLWQRKERAALLQSRLVEALDAPDYEHFMTIEYVCYDTPGLPGLTAAELPAKAGVDGEVQIVRLKDMDAFHAWCGQCGVSVD